MTLMFRAERNALQEALAVAARTTRSSGGAIPILEGVHLRVADGKLVVTGTTLDVTLKARLGVGGDEDGEAIVPARLLADIVKQMPAGAITCRVGNVTPDSYELLVQGGRSKVTLRGLNLAEWPKLTEPDGATVVVQGAVLAAAIRKVIPAASRDDSLPTISGVYLKPSGAHVRLAATDRYRLAVLDLDGLALAEDRPIIVPADALAEVLRLIPTKGEAGEVPVQVQVGKRDVTFRIAGAVQFTTKLLEGDYPPFEKLLPDSMAGSLTVAREAFRDAVKRVALMVTDAVTPVRVEVSQARVRATVTSQEVGTGESELDAVYDGPAMTIGFNPAFLVAGLNAIDTDEVVLEVENPAKPAILHGLDRPEYRYLLMPVRLTS